MLGLIIDAISESAWLADFDKINAHVSGVCQSKSKEDNFTNMSYLYQRWGNLKRRDGSPYTADCQKLVQSALLNNSHTGSNPLFLKKHSSKVTKYSLAPRAVSISIMEQTLNIFLLTLTRQFNYLRETGKLPAKLNTEGENCFSNVQRLVIEAILEHGGSADLDTILAEATKVGFSSSF